MSRPPSLVVAALVACAALPALAACTIPIPGGDAASSSPPADPAAGEVAFRLAGPGGAALVVPVTVNGQGPYDLILDTGATFTCMDTSLVRALALPERRLAVGTAVGIGGAGRVRLHAVDSLRLGAATTSGGSVCALDLQALRVIGPEVRGLLGLDFLQRFRVTLDFERKVLQLSKPASRRDASVHERTDGGRD